MLKIIAISNYRSLLNLVVPLGQLNVITGPNGSGKSNFYRALRLLAETAQSGVVSALAREGGLNSTVWAGPGKISSAMLKGDVDVEGTTRTEPFRLRLGFAGEELGYSVALGLPTPDVTAFGSDPEIKRECIWAGPFYRPSSLLVDRKESLIRSRSENGWTVVANYMSSFDSMFSQVADPASAPEVLHMREMIRGWRFYDHFRTDRDAPSRLPQIGTRTPVLHHEGGDLAAALQTIREIGDPTALDDAIADAFPGSKLNVVVNSDGRFTVQFLSDGLLRPLSGAELSDGTLRYLLWVAALLTPRPSQLMVLNEPETSLHPDLLPALARLIILASKNTQIWVVSHAKGLISALEKDKKCNSIKLVKELGQTKIKGQGILDRPTWHWAD